MDAKSIVIMVADVSMSLFRVDLVERRLRPSQKTIGRDCTVDQPLHRGDLSDQQSVRCGRKSTRRWCSMSTSINFEFRQDDGEEWEVKKVWVK